MSRKTAITTHGMNKTISFARAIIKNIDNKIKVIICCSIFSMANRPLSVVVVPSIHSIPCSFESRSILSLSSCPSHRASPIHPILGLASRLPIRRPIRVLNNQRMTIIKVHFGMSSKLPPTSPAAASARSPSPLGIGRVDGEQKEEQEGAEQQQQKGGIRFGDGGTRSSGGRHFC